jgi:hypothetical protein
MAEIGGFVLVQAPKRPSTGVIPQSWTRRKFFAQGKILSCRLCPLSAGRIQAVPGEGNIDSRLMFVGEAPGRDDDQREGRHGVARVSWRP